MILIGLLTFTLFASALSSALGASFSGAVLVAGFGAAGALGVAAPRTRAALFEALRRLAPAGGVLALLAAAAGAAFGPGQGRAYVHDAQLALGVWSALAIGAVVMAAGAQANRARSGAILLAAPMALAALSLVDAFDSRLDFFGLAVSTGRAGPSGPFPSPHAAGAFYTLMALLGMFLGIDELRRRAAQAGPTRPLAQRLFAPLAGILVCAAMALLHAPLTAAIALGAGALVQGGAMAWREQRFGPQIRKWAAGAALGSLGLSLLAGLGAIAWLAPTVLGEAVEGDAARLAALWAGHPWVGLGPGHPDARNGPQALAWLSEMGAIGALFAILAGGGLFYGAGRAMDRGRRPARMLALTASLAAAAAIFCVQGAPLGEPAILGGLAAAIGLASSYQDSAQRLTPARRTTHSRRLAT